MEEQVKMCLRVLSPVHIGCGDVYEPTSFLIDRGQNQMIVFDPLEFTKNIGGDDRNKFEEICEKGTIVSIIELFDFISSKRTLVSGRPVEISQQIAKHYNDKIRGLRQREESKIKQELNNFSISRTAYNSHTQLPYIPGSSVKGSLRTAYLSLLAQQANIKKYWENMVKERKPDIVYKEIGKQKIAQKLEHKLLGIPSQQQKNPFELDPFRMMKVSDFLPVQCLKTKILYAINKKKSPGNNEARGPFQILEVIMPGSIFVGTITIAKPHERSGIKHPITLEDLFKALNAFYSTNLQTETELLQFIKVGNNVQMEIANQFEGKIGVSAFVARIGRHSGAEAVTVENNRFIKINMGDKSQNKFLESSTTVWLASDTSKPQTNDALSPFGWVVLEKTDMDFGEIITPVCFKIDQSAAAVHQQAPVTEIPQAPSAPPERPLNSFLKKIKVCRPTEMGAICQIIDDALKQLEKEDEKKEFARAVKAHMGDMFKKSKAEARLKAFIE